MLMRFALTTIFFAVLGGLLLAADQPSTNQTSAQKAWEILDAGVREKSFLKRHDAVHALGLLEGDSRAVDFAEKALSDHTPEVREAAATTLGNMHSHASIPKLKQALKDKDVTVVLAAAHSLWGLGDIDGYEVYYEILVGERKAGQGVIAGQEAMLRDRKKLAEFGFEQGIEFNPFAGIGWGIIKTLHKDDVSPVRAQAAAALMNDSDPRSGQALAKSCTDKSWIVRVAALEALARRGDPAFVKVVEPHTTDEKDMVRYTAAAALIRLSRATPRTSALTPTAP